MAKRVKRAWFIWPTLAVALCLLWWLGRAVFSSRYFKITRVETEGAADGVERLNRFIGRNIFEVDLKKTEKEILSRHPVLRGAELRRCLPDTLMLKAERRIARARLKVRGKFYLVDFQGVVLGVAVGDRYSGLPQIEGVGGGWGNMRVGRRLAMPALKMALKILQEYTKLDALEAYRIEDINTANLSRAYFYIRPRAKDAANKGLRVIIGKEDIRRRLEILSSLLSAGGVKAGDARYIDLRFDDPVAG
ncbi:MAG: cell division protein FtsQ/DivIB [Candidatus Omnitrophota bacterium]